MTPAEKEQKKSNKPAFTDLSDSDFSTPVSAKFSTSADASTDTQSVCSATDCTGLIPALPNSEAELEAYEAMYQFCLGNETQEF